MTYASRSNEQLWDAATDLARRHSARVELRQFPVFTGRGFRSPGQFTNILGIVVGDGPNLVVATGQDHGDEPATAEMLFDSAAANAGDSEQAERIRHEVTAIYFPRLNTVGHEWGIRYTPCDRPAPPHAFDLDLADPDNAALATTYPYQPDGQPHAVVIDGLEMGLKDANRYWDLANPASHPYRPEQVWAVANTLVEFGALQRSGDDFSSGGRDTLALNYHQMDHYVLPPEQMSRLLLAASVDPTRRAVADEILRHLERGEPMTLLAGVCPPHPDFAGPQQLALSKQIGIYLSDGYAVDGMLVSPYDGQSKPVAAENGLAQVLGSSGTTGLVELAHVEHHPTLGPAILDPNRLHLRLLSGLVNGDVAAVDPGRWNSLPRPTAKDLASGDPTTQAGLRQLLTYPGQLAPLVGDDLTATLTAGGRYPLAPDASPGRHGLGPAELGWPRFQEEVARHRVGVSLRR